MLVLKKSIFLGFFLPNAAVICETIFLYFVAKWGTLINRNLSRGGGRYSFFTFQGEILVFTSLGGGLIPIAPPPVYASAVTTVYIPVYFQMIQMDEQLGFLEKKLNVQLLDIIRVRLPYIHSRVGFLIVRRTSYRLKLKYFCLAN